MRISLRFSHDRMIRCFLYLSLNSFTVDSEDNLCRMSPSISVVNSSYQEFRCIVAEFIHIIESAYANFLLQLHQRSRMTVEVEGNST